MNDTILKNDKTALIIKLSPINGLNSSMMRTLALVKGFVTIGYSVDFLTIRESDTTVLCDISKYDFLEKVRIIYANSNAIYDRIVSNNRGIKKKITKILRKIYHKFSIYDYSYNIAKKIKIGLINNRYDIIISVSDPKTSHIAMKSLIKQGLEYDKWIQYWGDPMTIDITNKSIYPSFVYRILEKGLFSNSDTIVYTSPFTVNEQSKVFKQFASKMKYVPTAYIEEKKYPKADGNFTIGYYGAYTSKTRNILPLYNACSKISKVNLIIVGNSDITLETTNNISVYPRGDISNFEIKTDLYVCVLNSSGTQIPGKVYHYAATNRPVLIILDGEHANEMKEFFEQFKRYEMCMNDEESITSTIEKIMSKNEMLTPCKQFSCIEVVKKIIE